MDALPTFSPMKLYLIISLVSRLMNWFCTCATTKERRYDLISCAIYTFWVPGLILLGRFERASHGESRNFSNTLLLKSCSIFFTFAIVSVSKPFVKVELIIVMHMISFDSLVRLFNKDILAKAKVYWLQLCICFLIPSHMSFSE